MSIRKVTLYAVIVTINRDVIFEGCESSIWYNGYVGSLSFDEFELKIYATGNIKGTLYINYEEILTLNSEDVANELRKYIRNDQELLEIIEFMPYDEETLRENNGTAFFVIDTNWFTASLVDNVKGIVVADGLILDEDNLIDNMNIFSTFFDFIFSNLEENDD